jgi:hypothetical protein
VKHTTTSVRHRQELEFDKMVPAMSKSVLLDNSMSEDGFTFKIK